MKFDKRPEPLRPSSSGRPFNDTFAGVEILFFITTAGFFVFLGYMLCLMVHR